MTESIRSCVRKGCAATGVDISPTAIEWARTLAVEQELVADFRVGNVLDLPFPDSSFDVIVDGKLAHCIIPGDRTRLWSEVLRVLKDI